MHCKPGAPSIDVLKRRMLRHKLPHGGLPRRRTMAPARSVIIANASATADYGTNTALAIRTLARNNVVAMIDIRLDRMTACQG